jgi:segregation and condensation protein A
MAFEVQTETFTGPFDLLLQLILKDEVDLYAISLAEIVDAYLAEIERMDLCDLDVATEFLLIAATLVELKCRRLLPVDDSIDLDEELGLWEERDLLLSRLLECKTFKDAARVIDQLAVHAGLSMPRRVGPEEQYLELAPDLLSGISPEHLRRAFLRAATFKPPPQVSLGHITVVTASVNAAIEELLDELPRSGPMSFRRLTSGLVDRLEVVVRFLAVLELFKQGMVDIDQPRIFGDLTIRWTGLGPSGTLAAEALESDDVDLGGGGPVDDRLVVDRVGVLAGIDTYEG